MEIQRKCLKCSFHAFLSCQPFFLISIFHFSVFIHATLAALTLKLINCLKCHRSFTRPADPLFCFSRFFGSACSGPSKAAFKDGFFKVHVGRTQLATLVAVETRLTHGQVVENSGSGSLRGYRDLSRFMDFTVQLYRPSGDLSTRRGENIRLPAGTGTTRQSGTKGI